MRGLILQLAKVDSEAEAQVRIVDFFDSLLRSHATLENVLRSTAGLTGVQVGVTLSATGEVIGFDGQGRRLDLDPAMVDDLNHRLIVSAGREVAKAWIDDRDGHNSMTDLVLERLVLTCEVLWESDELGAESVALERLLDPDGPQHERDHAASLLRRRTGRDVRVLCLESTGTAAPGTAWFKDVEASTAHQMRLRRVDLVSCRWRDRLWVVVPPQLPSDFTAPSASRVGVGPARPLEDAASSGLLASRALAFTRGTTPEGVVRYDDVGPVCLLDVRDNATLLADPFVRAVVEHLRTDPSLQPVLVALAGQGSIRAAAKRLHMHHSTVSARIERMEQATGLDLREPSSLFSLRLALAWHGTAPGH